MCSISSSCCSRVAMREVVERHGVADAGDDVFALCVGQVVAVGAGAPVAGSRVNATPVPLSSPRLPNTIDHHVDGRAEVVGDRLLASVEPGAVAVPRSEDGQHCVIELVERVLRERRDRSRRG